MTTARTQDSNEPARVLVGVAVPLAVLAMAYGLWQFSDHVGYVGPLDRAAFGWAIVIPVWLGTPVAAGWAWRHLTARATTAARWIVGATLSIASAVLLWVATSAPACDFGPRTAPIGWVLPSLLVGLLLGAGLVLGGSLARNELRGGRRSTAVMLGVAAQAGFAVLALGVLTWALVAQGGCQPPSGL